MRAPTSPFSLVVRGGLVAVLTATSGVSHADTLVYLSANGLGQGASPVSSYETLQLVPGSNSLYVWVQPDELLTGISLDLDAAGSAIEFTGSTVHNPAVGADLRWLPALVRDDDFDSDEVNRIEGGGLAAVGGYGTGVGPSTSSSDPLYEAGAGFLFATIGFDVVATSGSSSVSLSIGHNLFSDAQGVATGSIYLGVSDGPVSNMSGASGGEIDLMVVAQQPLAADFNSSGDVDGADFLIWQKGYGITSGAMRAQGDATGDGQVNAADLETWQDQFGTTPSVAASHSVPEPTALGLIACGTIAGLAGAWRSRVARVGDRR